MSQNSDSVAIKSTALPEAGNEEVAQQQEFNTWLKTVEKALATYPPNVQVQAVNHLYTETYARLEAEVQNQKATLTAAERVFSGLLFKVTPNK